MNRLVETIDVLVKFTQHQLATSGDIEPVPFDYLYNCKELFNTLEAVVNQTTTQPLLYDPLWKCPCVVPCYIPETPSSAPHLCTTCNHRACCSQCLIKHLLNMHGPLIFAQTMIAINRKKIFFFIFNNGLWRSCGNYFWYCDFGSHIYWDSPHDGRASHLLLLLCQCAVAHLFGTLPLLHHLHAVWVCCYFFNLAVHH